MDPVDPDRRERIALWLSAAVITGIVIAQAPGRIVPETKLDITLSPLAYLGRALHAWDPTAGFGRLQNQAIGYLFPMGAFSSVGHLANVPPWLVQRLWISAVICLGVWGAHRVASAIGIGSPTGRLVAALAYGLAPATLGVAAFQSAGQLPYSLAPHVLVPLLAWSPQQDPRRAAARSAMWVALMGGVNAGSTLAVVPLVLLWFLTRTPGPERRRLALWWAGGMVAATAWWVIPLLVSVRYGIRFTDFTETAALTTTTESATEVLRGTGNWLAYLVNGNRFWVPGAAKMALGAVAVAGSALVAAGGLGGLARRDQPERRWLVPSLVLGAIVIGAGYGGPWGGTLDGPVRQMLDGPLAPLRNVHKFSALVRLPLALGLGHLVVVAADALASKDAGRVRVRVGGLAAVGVVVLAIIPAVGGHLAAPGSFTDVPDGWRDAQSWIDDQPGESRALLLPGAAFGEYRWGRPLDEPISSLGNDDWATRDLIPLGGNGSTRLLDGLDEALTQGDLPPGFDSALQRAGVTYLVVRNDLDLDHTGGPSPATMRRMLAQAPEVIFEASFGAEVSVVDQPGRAPDRSDLAPYREIDIYRVAFSTKPAVTYPLDATAIVEGGPEALVTMSPDLVEGRATVLAGDAASLDLAEPHVIGTDTARRRDVRFGTIRANATYTLAADEPSPFTGEAPVDRWAMDPPDGLTVARVDGAASITESSARFRPAIPEVQPFGAFDGDPSTIWLPAPGDDDQWVQVTLDPPAPVGTISIAVPSTIGPHVERVEVTTDAGTRTVDIGDGVTALVPDLGGTTSSIRVTVVETSGTHRSLTGGISEIDIDGLSLSRPLVVPDLNGSGASALALSRARQDPVLLNRASEDLILDRVFTWGGPSQVVLSGTASAVPGPELDQALDDATSTSPDGLDASASSTFRGLSIVDPARAVDGQAWTAWVSGTVDHDPTLTLKWASSTLIDSFTVDFDPNFVRPDSVEVAIGNNTVTAPIAPDGTVSIDPTPADQIELRFPSNPADPRVGVSEVTIPALVGLTAATPDRTRIVSFPCGEGPTVIVDDQPVPTRATAMVAQLEHSTAVMWTACDELPLSQGEHRITAGTSGSSLQVDTLTATGVGGLGAAEATRGATISKWEAGERTLDVEAGDSAILATTENFNPGWKATSNGNTLKAIRVDGWRQGWVLPAGAATQVDLRFGPERLQRIGLIVGAGALLGLVAVALWRRPRWSRDAGPIVTRRQHPAVAMVLAGGAGFALGGPVALLAVPLIFVARRLGPMTWISAGATMGAGLVALQAAGAPIGSGSGTFSAAAQSLAVIAIMAVAASLVTPDD